MRSPRRAILEETGTQRRSLLSGLAAVPLLAGFFGASAAGDPKRSLKIMMKSGGGSDDPTKAAFPFLHGHALAEAGHDVQIFLLGEAVSLMRSSVAKAVVPVGWPPLSETLDKPVLKPPCRGARSLPRAGGVPGGGVRFDTRARSRSRTGNTSPRPGCSSRR